MKIGIIGAGNIAGAIISGALKSGRTAAEDLVIYDLNGEKAEALADKFSVCAAPCAADVVRRCGRAIIAVKPKDFPAAVDSIRDEVLKRGAVVISVAAGVEIKRIRELFGFDAKIVRIMPNLNAGVGEASTAVCASDEVSEDEKESVTEFCSRFGGVFPIEEKYFSAFTALAGSSPAFVFMFCEALAAAGVKLGLSAKISREIAARTVLGGGKTLLESPLAISELIAGVCSPGGTTIEGVCGLMETGFGGSIIKAVDKTAEKDRIMSLDR